MFCFSVFTPEEIAELRRVKLWDIIVNATDIEPDEIQRNVFFWNEGDPCQQPQQLNASILEPCPFLKGYDYFEVSGIFKTSNCSTLDDFQLLKNVV